MNANELLKGFVDDKIWYIFDSLLINIHADQSRLNYTSYTRQLTIRRPTILHDFFIQEVVSDIRDQLDIIRSGSDSDAIFARDICPGRSTTIILGGNFPSRHDLMILFDIEMLNILASLFKSHTAKREQVWK